MVRRRINQLLKCMLGLATLAFLAAILFPVFGNAKHNWRRSSCQSNLKQILLAVRSYSQDCGGRFPLLKCRHGAATVPISSGYVKSLRPYLGGFSMFQCPSEESYRLGSTDYAYNNGPLAGRYESIALSSGSTVIFCECNETPGAGASASAPIISNRHAEGSNYAFVDGHVKWLQSPQAPSPSNVPATGANFTFGT